MTITRRTALKSLSLGSSTLLLAPLLSRIEAEAAGSEARPTRFVFVVEGNGLPPEQVHPEGIEYKAREKRDKFEEFSLTSFNRVPGTRDSGSGPRADGSETRGGNAVPAQANGQAVKREIKLPFSLEPVAEFQNKLTVIQGLSGKICGGGHSNNFGALGAYAGRGGVGNSGSAPGETIDAALAKQLGGIFPVVGLGISDRPEHTVIYNCSAWGRGQKLPTQCRPDLAYATLFGSVADGEGKKDFDADQDLLDFMVGDIKRVQGALGSADREKLDSYLGAYENLRQRQQRLVEVRDRLANVAPVPNDKFKSEVETDRLDAHFDLAAAALIGGLTNVVTLASGVGDPFFSVRFHGLGISLDKHSIGHGGSFQNRDWADLSTTIRNFHFKLIARLMKQLQAVPEGNGTMLDNTLIVYLSDAAEGHHSRCWEWPFVLLGDLGGRLKSGRCLSYPNYATAGHRTINGLYTTLLHTAGNPATTFGQADPMLKDFDQTGPLPELLA
ncbi:MAG: DUF1552 domain-containing protein [Pirellulaceae bacterium]